jgi:hypothetical protein
MSFIDQEFKKVGNAVFIRLVIVLLLSAIAASSCAAPLLPNEVAAGSVSISTQLPEQQTFDATVTLTPTPVTIRPAHPELVLSNCTYSQYYWRDHSEAWLTENIYIGRKNYTKDEALAILAGSSQDDISEVLKQFFAAGLNILKGAESRIIEGEILRAGNWLDERPLGTALGDQDRSVAKEIVTVLAAYNHGQIGPGPCTDEPAPLPSYTPLPPGLASATAVQATPIPGLVFPTQVLSTNILPTWFATMDPTKVFRQYVTPTNPPSPRRTAKPPATKAPTKPPTNPPPTEPPPTKEPTTERPPTREPPTEPPPPPPPTEPPPEHPTPTSPPELVGPFAWIAKIFLPNQ